MAWLGSMTLRSRVTLSFAVAVGTVLLIAGSSYWLVKDVCIGSPHYASVMANKDLLADVLPPPAFVVQSYLLANRLLLEPDATERQVLIQELERQKTTFERRHAHWRTELEPGTNRTLFLEDSYRPAAKFFSQLETQLIPALERGERDKALALLHGPMRTAFEQHEAEIDQVVRASQSGVLAHEREAADHLRSRATIVGALCGAGILLMLVLGAAVLRSLSFTLSETLRVFRSLANRDLTTRFESRADDELGQIGSAVNEALDGMCQALEAINQQIATLATASDGLTEVSQQMSANAEQTAAQAHVVSAASEQVSRTLQLVSGAAEQMNGGVRELSRGSDEANAVASKAVRLAESASSAMHRLAESSAGIGKVVEVISSVAEQTNLLALNATIEAARAGDAGKGFAVVANEVKELAAETSRATEDIGKKIQTIRADATSAVDAISEIRIVIARISELQSGVAASLEESAASIASISRTLGEGARGTGEITNNIGGVATAARGTSSGAADTRNAAEELARMAAELRRVLAGFAY